MDFKKAFYEIRRHLRQSGAHFARIASGAGFEQWLNAEVVVCLAQSQWLAKNERVAGEHRKRDIVVVESDRVTHVIEVKILWQWNDTKLRREKLRPLHLQLTGERHDEESDRVRRHGLLVGVWFDQPGSKYAIKEGSEGACFTRYSRLAQEVFPAAQFATQHRYCFERVFPRGPANVRERSGESWKIQIGLLPLTLRRQVEEPDPVAPRARR